MHVPGAFHAPSLTSSSQQHDEVSNPINPILQRWKLRLQEVTRPALGDHWMVVPEIVSQPSLPWLIPVGLCVTGGILSAGPCPQVPPWSACPPGSTATCTSPWWSPALCTAPSPSGYSCGGMEPGWARRGTFSEWFRAARCSQPQGSWGPDALEGSKGSGWQEWDLGLSHIVLLGTSQLGQGWGRVVP